MTCNIVILLSLLTICSLSGLELNNSTSLYSESAFCRSYASISSYQQVNHPMSVTEHHIPWVWEAVYDPVESYVEIIAISPTACSFNVTMWQYVSRHYPQYHKFLGGGLSSNVLVNPGCNEPAMPPPLRGERFLCIFVLNGDVVYKHPSTRIRFRYPMLGNLDIRCKVPEGIVFDSMQLETNGEATFCRYLQGRFHGYGNATKVFPVCTVPHYDKHHKQYNLSIVSATSRADASKMVEWLEYHLVLGVQHFFLYNTATDSETQTRLIQILAPYVRDGTVTLIPWYFMNCVRGMGSGRKIRTGFKVFVSPHPIANYAALNSAYTRFRHTSTYILYVDDDEFVSLSSAVTSESKSPPNIYNVAHEFFEQNPNHSAILFHPIDMNSCPTQDEKYSRPGINSSAIIPRLNQYLYASVSFGSLFEHKPLMKTESVSYFSVHYITLVEETFHNHTAVSLDYHYPIERGALLHYKTPAYVSHDPFSYNGQLPIPNIIQFGSCTMQESQWLRAPYHQGVGHENVNITGHLVPDLIMKTLDKAIKSRMFD